MARTLRERYLAALRGEGQEEMIFAPNFDYYLTVNRARGTLPEKYRDMSRNDMVRAVGGAIWNRTNCIKNVVDKSVKFSSQTDENGTTIDTVETPVGSMWQEHRRAEDEFSSKVLTKHYVTDLETLRVMQYLVEATDYEADYAPVYRALEETGDDGVVLASEFCVPFIQFAKTDVGYLNAFFMWSDYPDEVEKLVQTYEDKIIEKVRIMVKSPIDIINCNDNMDEQTMSPAFFKRYAIPFYHRVKKEVEGSGKLFEAHWCGRTPHLIPMVKDTGLDVVEAVVSEPMAAITLDRILELLDGKTTLQGGIPAIYMCPNVTSDEEFETYITEVVKAQKGRPGYIVGMSDNVPPDADFSRVERVVQLLK